MAHLGIPSPEAGHKDRHAADPTNLQEMQGCGIVTMASIGLARIGSASPYLNLSLVQESQVVKRSGSIAHSNVR